VRYIQKHGYSGHHLRNAHSNAPTTKDAAQSRWSNLQDKPRLLLTLLEEQFYLCCYSELRADLAGLGHHIEHVQPKSAYPARTFDYQNLAVAALDSEHDLKDFKISALDIFGAHAKGSQYDENLFVSCLQPDCERYFAYLSDGRVVAALGLDATDIAKANYTIALLKLNYPFLVTKRRNWWIELETLYDAHQQNRWSLVHLAAIDLLPAQSKLSPFFSLTRQFFGRIAEQVLAKSAAQFI
jgi:uncharacterized protein (TIGR02646 family)